MKTESRDQVADLLATVLHYQRMTEFLNQDFLKAVNDIGRYGFEKYGKNSFQARCASENPLIRDQRTESEVIAAHAKEHFAQYLSGIKHDYFDDEIHQLAAVAFNAMMEAVFAKLVK